MSRIESKLDKLNKLVHSKDKNFPAGWKATDSNYLVHSKDKHLLDGWNATFLNTLNKTTKTETTKINKVINQLKPTCHVTGRSRKAGNKTDTCNSINKSQVFQSRQKCEDGLPTHCYCLIVHSNCYNNNKKVSAPCRQHTGSNTNLVCC